MTGCKLANAGERLPRRRKGDAELGRHNWYTVSPPSLAGQFVNTKENNMSNDCSERKEKPIIRKKADGFADLAAAFGVQDGKNYTIYVNEEVKP